MFILYHNFWTRIAKKSIKDSKDSDFGLVSNKNLSEILLSNGWALGQVAWAKVVKNLSYLWCHSQKTWNQNFFFIADLKTCRIFWGFEQLFSTINWQVMELQSGVKLVLNVWFQSTMHSYTSFRRVNALCN